MMNELQSFLHATEGAEAVVITQRNSDILLERHTMDDAAALRRAQYLYLTALVKLYEGRTDCAQAMLRESYALNNENLFCGFYAREARL